MRSGGRSVQQRNVFRLLTSTATPPPTQQVILAGRLIPYALRRDGRRLTLRIDARGLRVGAPRALSLGAIAAFITQHGDWVLQKLDEFTARAAPRYLSIEEGTRLPLLGAEVRVRVTAGANRGYWQADELWLAARPAADLALLARRALQRRAMEHFAPLLASRVAQLGHPLPALALSSARTRWGSCSAKSGIRLNWRLIHLPPHLIDYVISHEVAHLVEMNHSPRFWAVVAQLYPAWRAARDELKRQGRGLPLL